MATKTITHDLSPRILIIVAIGFLLFSGIAEGAWLPANLTGATDSPSPFKTWEDTPNGARLAWTAFNASFNGQTIKYLNTTFTCFGVADADCWNPTYSASGNRNMYIDLGASYNLTHYGLRSYAGGNNLVNWTVAVSSDNTTYTLWDSKQAQGSNSQQFANYTPTNSVNARYVRLTGGKGATNGDVMVSTLVFYSAPIVTPPAKSNITFINRTPSDITSTALFSQNATFTYEYNTTALNSAFITYYGNSSIHSCLVSVNGSCLRINGTSYTVYGSFSGATQFENVTYRLGENDVYPSISNKNVSVTASNVINITGNNNYLYDAYQNISTSRSYGFYEFMINTTGAYSIYYANSSYDFNSNPSLSNNAHLLCNIDGTIVNHTHGANFDNLCAFTVNASGFIGTVKATSSGGFIIRGVPQEMKLYGYSGSARVNTTILSTNNGVSWNEQAITLRTHLHQFSGNDSFCWSGRGNFTTGTNPQSNGTMCDTLDITLQPPEAPTVYTPNKTNYTRFINITYEQSNPTVPNSVVTYYNITLRNNDSTFNSTIYANNSLNTSYYWNSYSRNLTVGQYYIIRVTAFDNNSLSSYAESTPFTVDTNSLLNISPRNIFGNVSINNATIVTITDISNNVSTNNTGVGSVVFDVVKGNNYTIVALPANFSYGNVTVTIPNSNYSVAHTYHYTENTFFITFYNETTNTKLNQTVYLEVISNNYSINYTVTGGNITLSFLTPNTYTFRYYNNPNVPRDYYTTLVPYSAQNISLYVVDEAISQFYVATLNDQNINKVANATVQLLRYYVDTNTYIVVEMATTNTNGEAIIRVVPNTIYYKLYFIKDGKILTTTPSKLISATGSYTINLKGSIISSYVYGGTLYKNLSYNNNTNTFVLAWSDSNNIVTQGCMIVRENDNAITTILYDSCASGAVGSIPYTLAPYNENNTYTANAWLKTSTQYSDYAVGSLFIGKASVLHVFGLIGVLIAVLFVIAFALIGGENGTRGTIISGILAILLLGIFGVIAYSPSVFIGIIIIGGIIVYKIRG